MAETISSPDYLKLAALLDRQGIVPWLQGICRLGSELDMAIVDASGRLFARTAGLAEQHLPLSPEDLKARAGDDPYIVAGYLVLPLQVAGNFAGALVVAGSDDGKRTAIGNIARQSLALLLAEAAMRQEKTHLLDEASKSISHLREINAIGRELSAMLALEPLLHRILRAAIDMTLTEEGAFFLVDEAAGELVCLEADGGAPDLVGLRLPKDAGIAGKALTTGRALIVDDVAENDDWYNKFDKIREFTTRSILAVPLMKGDTAIGVLEVVNRKDGQRFGQQDVDRLTALASQAVVAIETARLHKAEITRERLERELQLGQTMQASLIPSSVPVLKGWSFAAWWQPAREVSGDFYDFVDFTGSAGLVMADVAGKGVHAALFMALTRSTIRTSLQTREGLGGSLAASIGEANRLIAQDAKGGMFVTLCYARFRPDSGTVDYLNAGHNPPLWVRANGQEIVELAPTGLFLGYETDIPFEERSIHCAGGDIIAFYTDGVTEAMDADGRPFGDERLLAILDDAHGRPADEILAQIQLALAEHAGDTPQSDDITLVIARRQPSPTNEFPE